MERDTLIYNILLNASKYCKAIGNTLLITSKLYLLYKVLKNKSVAGISLKTNILYFVLYFMRYFHIRNWYFNNYTVLFYNIAKAFILIYQATMIYLISRKYSRSYYRKLDNFPISTILIFSVVSGFMVTSSYYIYYLEDLFYNISLIIESVAILPQLVMIQEEGDCELMNSHYIILIGLYRLFYLAYFVIYLTLIFGFFILQEFQLFIITSLVQTLLYFDFFYIYYKHYFSDVDRNVNIERINKEDTLGFYTKSFLGLSKHSA